MKISLVISALVFSSIAIANEKLVLGVPALESQLSSPFGAPVVPSAASVSNPHVGMIIYDASSNDFKGLNYDGEWNSMSAQGNPVSSDTPNERVERLLISSICSSSPCTIASQSGAVQSVTRNAVGNYTINFTSGKFSSAPTCAIVTMGTTNIYCAGNAASVGSFNFDCRRTSTEANVDTGVSVICMGAR